MRQPLPTAALFSATLLSGLLAWNLPASSLATPQPLPCPAAATAQLDGFYTWFLASGDRYRADFASQQQRFTPELYRDLRAGFALRPADGRFVDFDPFSNSQVTSYGHRIGGCRRDGSGPLLMRVEVQAGLRRSGALVRPLEYVLSPYGGNWRIADIRYPGESSFQLSTYLRTLLQPR